MTRLRIARLAAAAAMIGSLGFAASAGAAVTVFSNSFENGAFVDTDAGAPVAHKLPLGSTAMTGWTVSAGAPTDAVTWIQEVSFGLSTPSGEKFLDLTSYQNNGRGGVSTTLATLSGWTYTVQFDLGTSWNYNGATAAGIEVKAGAAPLGTFNFVAPANQNNLWQTQTTSTFAGTGGNVVLSFTGTSGVNYIGLDNVVVTAVPEPQAYALALAGLGLVGFVARRRKQA